MEFVLADLQAPPAAGHPGAHRSTMHSLTDQFGELEAQLCSLEAGPLQYRPKASQVGGSVGGMP